MLYLLLALLCVLVLLFTYHFYRIQSLKVQLEAVNNLLVPYANRARDAEREHNETLQRLSDDAVAGVQGPALKATPSPASPTTTYVAKEVVETRVGRKWVRVEVLKVDQSRKTLTVRKLTGKRRPTMRRGFEGVKRTGDRITANVFADWLTDNGLQEAADKLRQAFPLEDGIT